MVADVVVHEMTHAVLMLRGEPWCRMLTELSPDVLGREIIARPVGTRRVPNPARETDPGATKTIVVRRAEEGALAQADLATWPGSVRPAGYYADGRHIPVPTY